MFYNHSKVTDPLFFLEEHKTEGQCREEHRPKLWYPSTDVPCHLNKKRA